jgi:hypothetical protein
VETGSRHSDAGSCGSANSSLQSSLSGSGYMHSACNDSFDSSASTSSRNGSPAKIDDVAVASADDPSSTEQLVHADQQLVQADQQLLQLLADMNKMKRRCKHILDVTDRYCALRHGKNTRLAVSNIYKLFFEIRFFN